MGVGNDLLRRAHQAISPLARATHRFFIRGAAGFVVAALLAAGARAEPSGDFGPSLEIKHIDRDGRVTVETPLEPQGKAAPKLVPFPEDEFEAALPTRQAAASRPAPVKLAPPKESKFKPRFKTPAVRAVQHAEPITANEPAGGQPTASERAVSEPAATSAGPELQPQPLPTEPDVVGRALVDEAFAKSKLAKTEEDYTAVIDLCQRGAKAGLKRGYEDYDRRLLSWVYNRRGELRERAGKAPAALEDFEAAVKSNANSWRAIHNRGVSYAASGHLREALEDFNRTIELNKDHGNAYFNRGELKYAQGDFADAIRDYSAALRTSPQDPAILNSRGHAFYRLQKFGDALRDYSEAVRADPAFAPALINRGDTHSDLGQYGEAASDYRAAVEANPKLGKAYQSAAWLMATCPDEHYRNDKLAVEAARKALEIDGEADYRALETLAAAQANAGQFGDAKATQQKAVAKAPPSEAATAEKRLALYQHEQAYRERPRVAFEAPVEDEPVRKASATAPQRGKRRPSPNNR